MKTPGIQTVAEADESSAIDTLVLAFSADPIMRWGWPDANQYLECMPRFARAFGGRAFANGSAYGTENCWGVALWLPPDVTPDEEAVGELMESSLAQPTRGYVFAILEQMAEYHPTEPHWYLPIIGVDAARQGRGYGGALMGHAVQQCDRNHLPAYLESTNPRNIPLYQRHGFDVLGTIQVGDSPPVTPMLRAAR